MTQEKVANSMVLEFMEISDSMDFETAKKCALIMVQKLQDNQAIPPLGYTSSYDYWQGIKNQIQKKDE